MGAAHADIIPAQCRFNVIQRITDLCSQRFAGHAMNNVLILTFRELSAPTKRLPQPDRWNVYERFASHELFDSVGRFLVHGEFLIHSTMIDIPSTLE